jgi:hypothetical protein
MRAPGLLLLLAAAASADYRPLPLGDAILRADVIAVGTIDEVSSGRYRLHVERALVGASAGERLRVSCFEDWTCARREKPYRKGQRILAILGRFDEGLAPLGAACEGEVLLEEGKALVERYFEVVLEECDVRVHGRVIDEAELVAAVAEFRAGYRNDPASWRPLLESPRDLVASMTIDKLDRDSWTSEGLAAPVADAFPPLLAHRDARVRLTTAEALPRIVGRERARELAAAIRGKRGRGGLAPALALCHVDPGDTAALRDLLKALDGPAPTRQELRAVQDVLYDARPLGDARRDLYPACLALLDRGLSPHVEHALLVALRRWHGIWAPLAHEDLDAVRALWLARLRGA